ncbi:MAG: C69 family dipeptidase [Pirellulales bacterium]|nr:C69 family dipeptidase [Pirellulales bacterium]
MQPARFDSRAFLGAFLPPFVGILVAAAALPANACTCILVTRGASADGSVMITYHCDVPGAHASMRIQPAADHKPGEMIKISRGGKIAQVPHTYRVMGSKIGMMNEHQVAMSESTFWGRPELSNPQGLLNHVQMISLGLQRARTAREAIQVMTQLVAEHGYGDVGQAISVADPREAWILEIVAAGPGGKGGIWVAVRIPDGQISCHANAARIGEFPRNDPSNCLYSENVESFAVSKGWYDPKSGKPLRFDDAYCPRNPSLRRYSDTRVWNIFRRAAPSTPLSPDFHRSQPGAQPYPLSLTPDKKLTVADVFSLIRDHYEGTEYDMTQGAGAGPFGSPYRWRPPTWKVDGVEYGWERPVSTQQTAFSFVSQSRAWLPDPIGGLVWYGMDDSYTTCYVPFYCGIDAVPKSFAGGSSARFSWDSAWWIFNVVSNQAYGKYSSIMPEIQAAQKDVESNFLALQPAVEKTAVELAKTDPNLMTRYLTDYSVMHAEQTVARWRALAEHLIVKYNDGYVRNAQGKCQEVGYPEAWLRQVVREHPERFRIPAEKPPEK